MYSTKNPSYVSAGHLKMNEYKKYQKLSFKEYQLTFWSILKHYIILHCYALLERTDKCYKKYSYSILNGCNCKLWI